MIPNTGVQALPDELVDEILAPSPPPTWLEPLAELVAEKLGPMVRTEIRAALEAERGRAE